MRPHWHTYRTNWIQCISILKRLSENNWILGNNDGTGTMGICFTLFCWTFLGLGPLWTWGSSHHLQLWLHQKGMLLGRELLYNLLCNSITFEILSPLNWLNSHFVIEKYEPTFLQKYSFLLKTKILFVIFYTSKTVNTYLLIMLTFQDWVNQSYIFYVLITHFVIPMIFVIYFYSRVCIISIVRIKILYNSFCLYFISHVCLFVHHIVKPF